MRQSDILITNFYKKQKSFGYLQSINLRRNINDDGCSAYFFDLILSDYPFYSGDKILLLKFTGVKNIEIGCLEGLLRLLINIEDISSNQIEGVKYSVKEVENELFSFCCSAFEFEESIKGILSV